MSTRTQVATRAHNTTRQVHNSTRALDAITKKQMRGIKVLVLRNALSMLGYLLHAPRVPFIAPRQLGAIESIPGRLILPSVAWRTGQSAADFLPYLAKPTVGSLGAVGAPDTVRCPLPTVGSATCLARIAKPTVGQVDRWLTGQSGEL
jgi:hypothetical protein